MFHRAIRPKASETYLGPESLAQHPLEPKEWQDFEIRNLGKEGHRFVGDFS